MLNLNEKKTSLTGGFSAAKVELVENLDTGHRYVTKKGTLQQNINALLISEFLTFLLDGTKVSIDGKAYSFYIPKVRIDFDRQIQHQEFISELQSTINGKKIQGLASLDSLQEATHLAVIYQFLMLGDNMAHNHGIAQGKFAIFDCDEAFILGGSCKPSYSNIFFDKIQAVGLCFHNYFLDILALKFQVDKYSYVSFSGAHIPNLSLETWKEFFQGMLSGLELIQTRITDDFIMKIWGNSILEENLDYPNNVKNLIKNRLAAVGGTISYLKEVLEKKRFVPGVNIDETIAEALNREHDITSFLTALQSHLADGVNAHALGDIANLKPLNFQEIIPKGSKVPGRLYDFKASFEDVHISLDTDLSIISQAIARLTSTKISPLGLHFSYTCNGPHHAFIVANFCQILINAVLSDEHMQQIILVELDKLDDISANFLKENTYKNYKKLIQIMALLHDTGRPKDGIDQWDEINALNVVNNIEHFLTTHISSSLSISRIQNEVRRGIKHKGLLFGLVLEAADALHSGHAFHGGSWGDAEFDPDRIRLYKKYPLFRKTFLQIASEIRLLIPEPTPKNGGRFAAVTKYLMGYETQKDDSSILNPNYTEMINQEFKELDCSRFFLLNRYYLNRPLNSNITPIVYGPHNKSYATKRIEWFLNYVACNPQKKIIFHKNESGDYVANIENENFNISLELNYANLSHVEISSKNLLRLSAFMKNDNTVSASAKGNEEKTINRFLHNIIKEYTVSMFTLNDLVYRGSYDTDKDYTYNFLHLILQSYASNYYHKAMDTSYYCEERKILNVIQQLALLGYINGIKNRFLFLHEINTELLFKETLDRLKAWLIEKQGNNLTFIEGANQSIISLPSIKEIIALEGKYSILIPYLTGYNPLYRYETLYPYQVSYRIQQREIFLPLIQSFSFNNNTGLITSKNSNFLTTLRGGFRAQSIKNLSCFSVEDEVLVPAGYHLSYKQVSSKELEVFIRGDLIYDDYWPQHALRFASQKTHQILEPLTPYQARSFIFSFKKIFSNEENEYSLATLYKNFTFQELNWLEIIIIFFHYSYDTLEALNLLVSYLNEHNIMPEIELNSSYLYWLMLDNDIFNTKLLKQSIDYPQQMISLIKNLIQKFKSLKQSDLYSPWYIDVTKFDHDVIAKQTKMIKLIGQLNRLGPIDFLNSIKSEQFVWLARQATTDQRELIFVSVGNILPFTKNYIEIITKLLDFKPLISEILLILKQKCLSYIYNCYKYTISLCSHVSNQKSPESVLELLLSTPTLIIKYLINNKDSQIVNALMDTLNNMHLRIKTSNQFPLHFSTNYSLLIELFKTQIESETTLFKLKKFIVDLVGNSDLLEKIYHTYTAESLDRRFISAYKALPFQGIAMDTTAVTYTTNLLNSQLKCCTNSSDVYIFIEILAMKNLDPFDPLIIKHISTITLLTPLFQNKFRFASRLNNFINNSNNFSSPENTKINSTNRGMEFLRTVSSEKFEAEWQIHYQAVKEGKAKNIPASSTDLKVDYSNALVSRIAKTIDRQKKSPTTSVNNLFLLASEPRKKYRIKEIFSSFDRLVADKTIFAAEGLEAATQELDKISNLLPFRSKFYSQYYSYSIAVCIIHDIDPVPFQALMGRFGTKIIKAFIDNFCYVQEIKERLSSNSESHKSALSLLSSFYLSSSQDEQTSISFSNYYREIYKLIVARNDLTYASEFEENYKDIINPTHRIKPLFLTIDNLIKEGTFFTEKGWEAAANYLEKADGLLDDTPELKSHYFCFVIIIYLINDMTPQPLLDSSRDLGATIIKNFLVNFGQVRELQEFLSYDTETSKATLNLFKTYYCSSIKDAEITSLYSNYLTEILEMILTRKDVTLSAEFEQNHKGIISVRHDNNKYRFYQITKEENPAAATRTPYLEL